ncbi:MAG: rhomboid family intramembrane serine protease [Methylophilaceae bacterium]|nr:rhomboid family intramembrane serine protease [Methylophilaceae bacterium]
MNKPSPTIVLSLQDMLLQRVARASITQLLIVANLLVFLAMLMGGAGFWHSPNGIQLAWGANFGPATQDGEWWRLGSALFLHFGIVHLAMNMWALWDGGQFVERMYGHLRFLTIYFISGLAGNLLSLVVQGGHAVSGGASGAIFGVYGALLTFLWRERNNLHPGEFRWLFWAAVGFTLFSITLGFVVPGIDNSAHIGGFVTGLLSSMVLAQPLNSTQRLSAKNRWLAGSAFVVAIAILIYQIPKPAYRWSEEVQARKEIDEFMREDAAIKQTWQNIVTQSKQNNATLDGLANLIDSEIARHYEESFEQLSKLPVNSAMPSFMTIEKLLEYTETRRDESRALTRDLRFKSAIKSITQDMANSPENSDLPGKKSSQ